MIRFIGYNVPVFLCLLVIIATASSEDDLANQKAKDDFTNQMKDQYARQINSAAQKTYWNNYVECSRQCKIDVYESGISGCPLSNTCLCRNSFWLEATARCVKYRCGNEELLATAHETWRACEGWGGPMVLTEDEYIAAGFEVGRAPRTSISTTSADVSAGSGGNSSNGVGK
jgi:CFEM domain